MIFMTFLSSEEHKHYVYISTVFAIVFFFFQVTMHEDV